MRLQLIPMRIVALLFMAIFGLSRPSDAQRPGTSRVVLALPDTYPVQRRLDERRSIGYVTRSSDNPAVDMIVFNPEMFSAQSIAVATSLLMRLREDHQLTKGVRILIPELPNTETRFPAISKAMDGEALKLRDQSTVHLSGVGRARLLTYRTLDHLRR